MQFNIMDSRGYLTDTVLQKIKKIIKIDPDTVDEIKIIIEYKECVICSSCPPIESYTSNCNHLYCLDCFNIWSIFNNCCKKCNRLIN